VPVFERVILKKCYVLIRYPKSLSLNNVFHSSRHQLN